MVYDAIVFDSNARESPFRLGRCFEGLHHVYAASEQILERAKAIELSCFEEFRSANNDYRAKIRRLFLNLKDKSNPALREDVVSGELPVKKFCSMTNQVSVAHCLCAITIPGGY